MTKQLCRIRAFLISFILCNNKLFYKLLPQIANFSLLFRIILVQQSLMAVYTYKQKYLNQNKDINLPDISNLNSQIYNNISEIYSSDGVTLFLMSNRSLYGLGRNDYYQLTDQNTLYYTEPILIQENVSKCALGYRFISYIKDDQLYIKGLMNYEDIQLNENISNIYASSFTIIVSTQSNRYYYLGKNPSFDFTNSGILYSTKWQELQINHTIKSISTQQDIITIIDTSDAKHIYGTLSPYFENSFTKNDIVSTNNKNQVKFLASNGIIATYGNIQSQLGVKTFEQVDKEQLKSICLMNNEVAFIYKNSTADIFSSLDSITHVDGIYEQLADQQDFSVLCNNDQFTLITTTRIQSITDQKPQPGKEEDSNRSNNNQQSLSQIIILSVLIIIALALITASIVMLVFVKTNKLDQQLGPKIYINDKKENKQNQKPKSAKSNNENIQTADLELMDSKSPVSKQGRNDQKEQENQIINKKVDLPNLPKINQQQNIKPVKQTEFNILQSTQQNKQIDYQTVKPPALSLVNISGEQNGSNTLDPTVPQSNTVVKKVVKKKKVIKKVQQSKNQEMDQNLANSLDYLVNFGAI